MYADLVVVCTYVHYFFNPAATFGLGYFFFLKKGHSQMASLLCTTHAEFFILLQDNDWGDNTTAVTGLSDLAFPPESMVQFVKE